MKQGLGRHRKTPAPNGFAGTFSADYGNTSYSGGGGNADIWGVNGAGAFGLGMNDIGAEINGSYHRASVSSVDANIWGVGGSIFWAPGTGRFVCAPGGSTPANT